MRSTFFLPLSALCGIYYTYDIHAPHACFARLGVLFYYVLLCLGRWEGSFSAVGTLICWIYADLGYSTVDSG